MAISSPVNFHWFDGPKRPGGTSMDVNEAVRKEYCRPEIEDLGSLQELTAAGGPNFNVDSAYVHGSPGAGFGVS